MTRPAPAEIERRERDPRGDAATDHVRAVRYPTPRTVATYRGRSASSPELVAQPPDMDVDGPVEHVRLVLAVDGIEQLVAGQDPAAGLDEGRQEAELDGREGDRRAVAGDLVAVEVDDEVGQGERRTGGRVRCGRRRSGAGST